MTTRSKLDSRIAPTLRSSTREDIDARIARVLRDVGVSEAPCPLKDVHDALRVNVTYYRSDDPSLLDETVHRLRLATKHVAHNPMRILTAIKRWDLSALWLPDKRQILVDAALPPARYRWREAHETGHSLLPWHDAFAFGDNSKTLSVACHAALEAEANYAAGSLLFLQERFIRDAFDLPVGMAAVRALKAKYANSLTTTLWRYVERAHRDRAMVAIVGALPGTPITPDAPAIRHVVRSPRFAREFSEVTPEVLQAVVDGYIVARRGGSLGTSSASLASDAGVLQEFGWETFSNTHDALTLAYET